MPADNGVHLGEGQSQRHARTINMAPRCSKWEVYSLVLIRIGGMCALFCSLYAKGLLLQAYSCGDTHLSLLIDDPAFHDETDVSNRADLLQWVTGYGDYVSKIVRFQCSDLAFPSEQLGAVDEVSL